MECLNVFNIIVNFGLPPLYACWFLFSLLARAVDCCCINSWFEGFAKSESFVGLFLCQMFYVEDDNFLTKLCGLLNNRCQYLLVPG